MNNKFVSLAVSLIFFSNASASDKKLLERSDLDKSSVDRSSGQHFKAHLPQKQLRLRIFEKPRNKNPFQGKHLRIIAGSANAELEVAKTTIASLTDRISYLERAMSEKQEKLLSGPLENKDDILGVDWKSNDDKQKKEIACIYREELEKQKNPFSRATKKTSPQGKRAEHQGD